MAKATKKSQRPDADMEELTPTTKKKKKMKTAYKPSSRSTSKVLKATDKGKKPLERSSSKRSSEKSTTSLKKSKKAKGTTLFGHYHRLNEKLDKDQPEQTPKTMVSSSISSDDLESQ